MCLSCILGLSPPRAWKAIEADACGHIYNTHKGVRIIFLSAGVSSKLQWKKTAVRTTAAAPEIKHRVLLGLGWRDGNKNNNNKKHIQIYITSPALRLPNAPSRLHSNLHCRWACRYIVCVYIYIYN